MSDETIRASETAVDNKSAGDSLSARELAALRAEIATSRRGMMESNVIPKPIFTYYIR